MRNKSVNRGQSSFHEPKTLDDHLYKIVKDGEVVNLHDYARRNGSLKITLMGGGTGVPNVISGLRKYGVKEKIPIEITAIVNMADRGGHTGELLDAYGDLMAQGDLGNIFIALAGNDKRSKIICDIARHRFKGLYENVSMKNLLIAALEQVYVGRKKALEKLNILFNVKGRVIPASWEDMMLFAELKEPVLMDRDHFTDFLDDKIGPLHTNLRRLIGQGPIADPSWYWPESSITQVGFLSDVSANPQARLAIQESDIVVIGPGDLYSSVLPLFLKKGMRESFTSNEKRALVVYLANLMTKVQGTTNFTVSRHVKELETYLGEGIVDIVIYNNADAADHVRRGYRIKLQAQVQADPNEIVRLGYIPIGADLINQPLLVRHHPQKVASLLLNLPEHLKRGGYDNVFSMKGLRNMLGDLQCKGVLDP